MYPGSWFLSVDSFSIAGDVGVMWRHVAWNRDVVGVSRYYISYAYDGCVHSEWKDT